MGFVAEAVESRQRQLVDVVDSVGVITRTREAELRREVEEYIRRLADD